MKFLVDAQLPKALSDFLQAQGYDSIHTLELPEQNKTQDDFIANRAAKDRRIVISKDVDFLESYILRKIPPKLLLVKTGNIKNAQLIALFDTHLERLIQLFTDFSLIEMTQQEIIVHE